MNFHPFLPDYGVLPSAYFKKSAITNPIELFWSDDLLALLRLCGIKEELIGERASDYDRFLALCTALPWLSGHPTRKWILSVLEHHFDLRECPTQESAPAIWKALCQKLLQNPITPQDLVSGAWLCDALIVPSDLPENVVPVLNADLLLATSAKNAAAWSTEIADTVAHFAANGCQKVVFKLQNEFDFIAPSLYHVNRALAQPKRDREATSILTAQLARELSTLAQQYHLLLVLVCQKSATAAASLLQYVEESVGLPRICWSIREAREAYALLDFAAKPRQNEIFAALPYESVMTESELSADVESWQARYPAARLCFLTARDLRQTPFAQAHIADTLQKSKTKI